MQRSAIITPCGTYRYLLSRRWADGGSPLHFIMLNPSTADGQEDDPTIRRCIGFGKRFGFNAIDVMNLFALRATDPKELAKHGDPVGPMNDGFLSGFLPFSTVVAAWGTKGVLRGRDREVVKALQERNLWLDCLGKTKAGHPRHPLYLKKDVELIPFRGAHGEK